MATTTTFRTMIVMRATCALAAGMAATIARTLTGETTAATIARTIGSTTTITTSADTIADMATGVTTTATAASTPNGSSATGSTDGLPKSKLSYWAGSHESMPAAALAIATSTNPATEIGMVTVVSHSIPWTRLTSPVCSTSTTG